MIHIDYAVKIWFNTHRATNKKTHNSGIFIDG